MCLRKTADGDDDTHARWARQRSSGERWAHGNPEESPFRQKSQRAGKKRSSRVSDRKMMAIEKFDRQFAVFACFASGRLVAVG